MAETYEALKEHQERSTSTTTDLLRLERSLQEQLLEALELRPQECDLIRGFFDGPWHLIKGKLPEAAATPANPADIKQYCLTLRREMDEYLQARGVRHKIVVAMGDEQVCLTIQGMRTNEAIDPIIQEANDGGSEVLKRIAPRLRDQHSQRAYFEKSLSFYDRGRILFLKPRRRIEWNLRQALLDGDDLIADLQSGGE
jgi:hypothetical protein